MLLISGTSISFSWLGAIENIFTRLNFLIDSKSKIGLVGSNGCGKSTLLHILSGKLNNYQGQLSIKADLRISTLEQEITESGQQTLFEYLKPELAAIKNKIYLLETIIESNGIDYAKQSELYSEYSELDGYAIEAEIIRLLKSFSLEESFLERKIESLSGGEKNKVSLIRLLINKPDFLLLDEPTNHLDIISLEWLEKYLGEIKIPWLIVSHDRKFLDNCCKKTWELKNGSLTEYGGNYNFYTKEKNRILKRSIENTKQAQNKIYKLKVSTEKQKNDAREALEEALQNFNGTIILISHDRYFVEKISTRQIYL